MHLGKDRELLSLGHHASIKEIEDRVVVLVHEVLCCNFVLIFGLLKVSPQPFGRARLDRLEGRGIDRNIRMYVERLRILAEKDPVLRRKSNEIHVVLYSFTHQTKKMFE